jgi:hypothetical protein
MPSCGTRRHSPIRPRPSANAPGDFGFSADLGGSRPGGKGLGLAAVAGTVKALQGEGETSAEEPVNVISLVE